MTRTQSMHGQMGVQRYEQEKKDFKLVIIVATNSETLMTETNTILISGFHGIKVLEINYTSQ